MAYYARLGLNNMVMRVDSIENRHITTPGGIEKDSLAFEILEANYGAGIWVKCSYNKRIRANWPGGAWDEDNPWYYNSSLDIFHKGTPKDKAEELCGSWTLNSSTGNWEPPIPEPDRSRSDMTDGRIYRWDESVYQADTGSPKTLEWVLVDLS